MAWSSLSKSDHSNQVNKLHISFLVDTPSPQSITPEPCNLSTPPLTTISTPLLSQQLKPISEKSNLQNESQQQHQQQIQQHQHQHQQHQQQQQQHQQQQQQQTKPLSSLTSSTYVIPTLPSLVSSPISSVTYSDTLCRQCGLTTSSITDLDRHIRTQHRVKPFACRVCHKRFAERGNANKHYRVAHLKQRNHKCITCGRCFAFRDGLNRHISMVHLNQRPFECTECMCPSGPHNSSIACTHICGMRFKQKSHRRRHILSVHHAAGKRSITNGTRSSMILSQMISSNLNNTSTALSVLQSQQKQTQQQQQQG